MIYYILNEVTLQYKCTILHLALDL